LSQLRAILVNPSTTNNAFESAIIFYNCKSPEFLQTEIYICYKSLMLLY